MRWSFGSRGLRVHPDRTNLPLWLGAVMLVAVPLCVPVAIVGWTLIGFYRLWKKADGWYRAGWEPCER